MKIIREWMDFVIYPMNPNRISNAKERLNITGASKNTDELFLAKPEDRKFLVTLDSVLFEDDYDSFEAMGTDNYGNIIIWTNNKIWFLQRFGGMEKLHYVPRHPPK